VSAVSHALSKRRERFEDRCSCAPKPRRCPSFAREVVARLRAALRRVREREAAASAVSRAQYDFHLRRHPHFYHKPNNHRRTLCIQQSL